MNEKVVTASPFSVAPLAGRLRGTGVRTDAVMPARPPTSLSRLGEQIVPNPATWHNSPRAEDQPRAESYRVYHASFTCSSSPLEEGREPGHQEGELLGHVHPDEVLVLDSGLPAGVGE